MKICVDAGHGGRDSGAVAPDGTREKDLVLLYATELHDILVRAGHTVVKTRSTDVFVGLSERAEIANNHEADCFVSLHANSNQDPAAHGAWVLHDDQSETGPALARAIFRELAKVPGVPDSDPEEEVYPDDSPWVGNRDLAVLGQTAMTAVLVELGFLTNQYDLKELKQEKTRKEVCAAIHRGISRWAVDQGIQDVGDPVVDLEGDEDPDLYEDPDLPDEVETWRKPVEEISTGKENAGLFSVGVLKDLVESSVLDTLLNPVKKLLLKWALNFIEKQLRKLLGL